MRKEERKEGSVKKGRKEETVEVGVTMRFLCSKGGGTGEIAKEIKQGRVLWRRRHLT